jgi:hypothetical protein
MKHSILILIVAAATFGSCGTGTTTEGTLFGKAVDTAHVLDPDEAVAQLANSSNLICTINGTVEQVCQAEGCWLKLKMKDNTSLLVRTRDHSFTVPKDLAGRMVYVAGTAHMDTTDVATLQDYAKDEGKPDSVIAMITQPEISPVVEADGIFVK